MSVDVPTKTYRSIPIRALSADELLALSELMKLSLSGEDMLAVQAHFHELDREPTDVELEVIAQTWSEHCKHRIFSAEITHELDGKTETVQGIFKTYIKAITDQIMEQKPGFVLSCFHDNAGFIKLDEETAVCLKAETHNHPSAIEPYAGANTGLGGVIRDILGAAKGAKPIGSLDVFCFGQPDMDPTAVKGDTIHPLGILRGVVRGVRDYGNRMGIPTITGALNFHDAYTYNPLVFCGTAGVIPSKDIDKETRNGDLVVAVGGRTGRDGLHGAVFSSAGMGEDSHEEDKGAVQIGNPIEEKKVSDFVIQARDEGLIEFITDCGAGGFSSAAGEMISESGGEIYLETCPLKEPGLTSWEVFLSESQERMVLAVDPKNWDRIQELARIYETEATEIGRVSDSKVLRVFHHGETVCELHSEFLHVAPLKHFSARHQTRAVPAGEIGDVATLGADLKTVLGSFNVCSREPIIREYDHEVQGNTVIKPLSGPGGDCPQDASALSIDGTGKCIAMGVALLPQYGELDPYNMGLSSVDECIRQMVVAGADPDRLAILDNFCMGNPNEPEELGKLVETVKGIADAALAYQAPFISGKDSFYNYFETEDGPISIPVTILISGIGIIDDPAQLTGASLRRAGSVIGLIGDTHNETGGSAYALARGEEGTAVPGVKLEQALACYRKLHEAIKQGWILSAHDLSEGGLAVALAEMGFSLKAGMEIDLSALGDLAPQTLLFSESNSRIAVEIDPAHADAVAALFAELPYTPIGSSTDAHGCLQVRHGGSDVLNEELSTLKDLWKNGLTPYY
jgi:phosphoribosylformylglycinamidine synthase subunit PurSL